LCADIAAYIGVRALFRPPPDGVFLRFEAMPDTLPFDLGRSTVARFAFLTRS